MSLFDFYINKRVLITGHTGFKGSWLTLWLNRLGAHVTGWSIDIPTDPALFEIADVASVCDHHFGDINDYHALSKFIKSGAFDIVFHLAAQPLVRLSYNSPIETLTTNVVGTANVLEAVRAAGHRCAVVAVTSDKCYENLNSIWGFRETDPMGGSDPYSMSKGAAELVIASWRRSYFSDPSGKVRAASARAGNVIGGGDWAADRIITDCIRSLRADQPIELRNPNATRPWQHVLEPLSGYLALGALLASQPSGSYDSGWNFGPVMQDVRPVSEVAEGLIRHWGAGSWVDVSDALQPKEASKLSLNCDKANQLLRWQPVWRFERAIAETSLWFKALDHEETPMRDVSLAQIDRYHNDARSLGVAWAQTNRSLSA